MGTSVNKVLRIFGSKKEEVVREWRKLHEEKLLIDSHRRKCVDDETDRLYI
jgi:hypothetical protein